MAVHRRHDISDKVWGLLEPHLPDRSGAWGGIARENRLFIDAVSRIMRTGAPWRDLPPDYGCWHNTHRRFIRWPDKGGSTKIASGRVFAWYAGQGYCDRRDNGRWHSSQHLHKTWRL